VEKLPRELPFANLSGERIGFKRCVTCVLALVSSESNTFLSRRCWLVTETNTNPQID
jgi:hypothetical protein